MLGVAAGLGQASQMLGRLMRPQDFWDGPVANVQQPGFGGTSMAQHQFLRTERYQETPPQNLGRTAVFDESWATRAGGRQIRGPYLHETPEGRWNPLWADPDHRLGRLQQQYEWDFLTPHGAVEDVLLYRSQLSRAPPGNPYTIPTEHPGTTEKIQHQGRSIWAKQRK